MTLDEVGEPCEHDPAGHALRQRVAVGARRRCDVPLVVAFVVLGQRLLHALTGTRRRPVEMAIGRSLDKSLQLGPPHGDRVERGPGELDRLTLPGHPAVVLEREVAAVGQDEHRRHPHSDGGRGESNADL